MPRIVLVLVALMGVFAIQLVSASDSSQYALQCVDSDIQSVRRLVKKAQLFEEEGHLLEAKALYSRVLELSKNKPLETRQKRAVLIATRQSLSALKRLD